MQAGLTDVFQMMVLIANPIIWLGAIVVALHFRKFTSRSWIAVGGGALVFLSELAGSGIQFWMRANPEEASRMIAVYWLRSLFTYAGLILFLAGVALSLGEARERVRQLEEMIEYREHGRTEFD